MQEWTEHYLKPNETEGGGHDTESDSQDYGSSNINDLTVGQELIELDQELDDERGVESTMATAGKSSALA